MSARAHPLFDDLPREPDAILDRIFDPKRSHADLPRLYHQLRNVAPVHHSESERLGHPWVITRHADAAWVARERNLIKDGRLVDQLGGDPESLFAQVMKRMMVFVPAPRHTRLRQLVNRGFTKATVERLRPGVQAHIQQLIDEHLPKGGMDLVTDFAYPIPLAMICELIGVPRDDVRLIEEGSRAVIDSVDEGQVVTPDLAEKRDRAMRDFSRYFEGLISERRRQPREDLVSELVAVQRENDDLSDEDIVATCILLFQAGHDTTASLISKGMLALLQHPGQFALLRARPQLIENATEELLRFDTSVQLSVNFATADVPYEDRVIREGESVIILRGAANRDPARFANPDRLDIERDDIEHHSFGLGATFCLGASLARLEIQEAVLALVERIPGMEVEPERVVHRPSLHLNGLDSLPVQW